MTKTNNLNYILIVVTFVEIELFLVGDRAPHSARLMILGHPPLGVGAGADDLGSQHCLLDGPSHLPCVKTLKIYLHKNMFLYFGLTKLPTTSG